MENQAHYPLRAARRRHDFWRAHNIVSQPIAAIRMVGNLGLNQDHQVESANLYHLDGVCEPKYPAITDVEGPKG